MEPSPQNLPAAPDLESLCVKAAGGDDAAMEELLWHHQARLFGFLRRKVGVDWQGKIDAEDVLQEGYIEMVAAISGFSWNGEDSFYRWATRILDRTFIDRVRGLRRKKRDVAREVSGGTGGESETRRGLLLEHVLQDTVTASRIMRREDALAAMMACIAKLPEDYRVVVQRHYLEQEALKDIAADLGRSEDAVRRLAGRAVEQLNQCMGRATRYLSMRS